MESTKNIILYSVLVAGLIVAVGCGKKADENKPISEVKAEAEKMNTDELRASAMAYKKAIEAKKGDVEKLADQLKEIPVAEMLGDEAKSLKADMEKLQQSVSALQERFQIYYDKLKEKGGDVSGL
ncbi:MAG: hypothetical protein ACETVZ_07800 [Phycisphaerae bacterium]